MGILHLAPPSRKVCCPAVGRLPPEVRAGPGSGPIRSSQRGHNPVHSSLSPSHLLPGPSANSLPTQLHPKEGFPTPSSKCPGGGRWQKRRWSAWEGGSGGCRDFVLSCHQLSCLGASPPACLPAGDEVPSAPFFHLFLSQKLDGPKAGIVCTARAGDCVCLRGGPGMAGFLSRCVTLLSRPGSVLLC